MTLDFINALENALPFQFSEFWVFPLCNNRSMKLRFKTHGCKSLPKPLASHESTIWSALLKIPQNVDSNRKSGLLDITKGPCGKLVSWMRLLSSPLVLTGLACVQTSHTWYQWGLRKEIIRIMQLWNPAKGPFLRTCCCCCCIAVNSGFVTVMTALRNLFSISVL